MLEELSHMMGRGPGDPVSILVAASMFREEMPWLYELGMEAYRVAKEGSFEQTREALEQFRRAFHMMERGPFLKESDIDPEMFHMLERQLDHLVARPPREYRPEPKLEPVAPEPIEKPRVGRIKRKPPGSSSGG